MSTVHPANTGIDTAADQEPVLYTTLGLRRADELGMILPHEHVFVDLRPPGEQDHSGVTAEDVSGLMAPELARAKETGCTALVEGTPAGVGRRVDLVQAASRAAGLPVVVPTGIYREPWVPEWAMQASEESIRDWMVGELQDTVTGTSVRPAWIKLSAGDEGLTDVETKILRAAASAGAATGAVIGSHTIRGRVVHDQLDVIEQRGYRPDRFIWIHTQTEPDTALHLDVARRGAYIEYDKIGSAGLTDDWYIERIKNVLDAGLGDRLLLSHDRGWFDPAKPGGGQPKPFTYLAQSFVPALRAAGVPELEVRRLTVTNPFRAFAR